MARIHPTAVISPTAQLGVNVAVGPFAIIEDRVVIGDDCRIAGHSIIKSDTSLGARNAIHEGAVVGGLPQHIGLGPECGRLTIGDDNQIREYCTIHRAWKPEQVTVVGSRCMLMVNAHIAHDCHLGNDVILANNVMLAGHVTIGERAYLSGAVGVHQFCRIGRNAMVGGQAHVNRDVPPFVTVDGLTNRVVGLNLVGLRRAGMERHDIRELKDAYRLVFRSQLPWEQILSQLDRRFLDGPASEYSSFLRDGKRGFVPERSRVGIGESPVTLRYPEQEAA